MAPWRLSLYGDFRLLDETGEPVVLPNRKVEALLAVLVVHRAFGIDRDIAGEILWPEKPLEARRWNLRQALTRLRKVIGAEAIESTRDQCRLSSDRVWETDYETPSLRRSEAFMPGHSGEWFDDIRLESLEPSEGEQPPAVVENYLRTLRWYASNDPRGMFALLKASPSLARGIRFSDMIALLADVRHDDCCRGWAAYWQGAAEDDLQQCAKLLRIAFDEAASTGDLELASEACLELGKVYARIGRGDDAASLCRVASDLASRTRSPNGKANAHRLNGAVQIQMSGGQQGFDHLSAAEDLVDDPIERAILLSSRAWFEASSGLIDKARETMAGPLRIARETGHSRIDTVTKITQALLTAHSGDRGAAMEQLERLRDVARSSGSTQYVVYAEELLAKLLYLSGDKGLAERKLEAARKGRTKARMAVTPLESERLRSIR